MTTHILYRRLDIRRGDDRCASIAYCEVVVPDVAPHVLFPDRDRELMRQGMGGLVADVRAFAPDAEATCAACRVARAGARPKWPVRLWRRLTGTTPPVEPPPDLVSELAEEARHPDDDGAAS